MPIPSVPDHHVAAGTADRSGTAAHVDEPAVETPVFVPAGRRWSRRDTLRLAVAAVTVVAGGLAARHGVSSLERHTFEVVNGAPDAVYPVIWPAMQLGSLAGGLAVAVVMGWRTRRWSVGAAAVGAVVAAWVVAKVVKDLVRRGRPLGEGLTVDVRDHVSQGLGYVSGHATLAFALYAMVVPHLTPRWRGVALAVAVLVGLARVYSGAHLPLDVVGGAALGLLIGEGFRALETAWRSRRGHV